MKPRPKPAPASPEAALRYAALAQHAKRIGIVCLIALIALGLIWELRLIPWRPGASSLVLKVLPLCAALPGFFAGRRYTYQWMSLLVLIYFTEGIVSATSSTGLASSFGWVETALTVTLFVACAVYARMTESWRSPRVLG